jgi:chromosome partitioning protein
MAVEYAGNTHVIALVNQKGGVAKTTTAINLGASLGGKRCKVLLLDLDAQANATMGLGLVPEQLDATVYDVLGNPRVPLSDVIVPTPAEGLWLAPAHLNLSGCEVELASDLARPFILRNALQQYLASLDGHGYDYVLIDCPPSLGVLTLNGLLAANELLIPLEPKYFALAGMSMLNQLTGKIESQLGHSLELLGVLITMFDSRTNLHSVVADQIRDYFGEAVFNTLIYKNITISEAEMQALPVRLYDENSRGAKNYDALAKEVLQRERRKARHSR